MCASGLLADYRRNQPSHWLCLFRHGPTSPEKVVGVADGDMVTILDVTKVQHKVRLTGIDAPFQLHASSFYLRAPNTSRSSLLP